MDEHPKITALVPSYNHGRFIRQRVESILQQTYPNIELIVIDDCSSDESDEVIRSLQAQHGFKYVRNPRNSGTPFSAWESVLAHATGDYIWVCESDDYAEPTFLETAVAALSTNHDAVLFYCNSWVVDASGQRVGHTKSYFSDYWKDARWEAAFSAVGSQELATFQLRGQTVPNMSSAVISTQAFRSAYTPFLKKLSLTGDWLFVGLVMKQGNVLFSPLALNNFRKHQSTARALVTSAREQAEFILTIYLLFRVARRPIREFARFMAPPASRLLSGPAKIGDVLKVLLSISWTDACRCMLLLAASMPMNLVYFRMFLARISGDKMRS